MAPGYTFFPFITIYYYIIMMLYSCCLYGFDEKHTKTMWFFDTLLMVNETLTGTGAKIMSLIIIDVNCKRKVV